MVIQRLEMCIELMKLALEFVLLVAQAVEIALQHNVSPFTSYSAYSSVPVHSVGGSCSTQPPDAWSSTHHHDDDDEQESHELGASFCPASPEPSSPPRLAFYFDCKLCLKMAREPVVTPCGPLFSGDCLDKWLHFFTSQMECSVCHSKVLDSSIIPIRPTPVCNRDLDLNVPPRSKGGLCF
ncbi:PREDICTED: E3 ubiquitin-ligase [Prunus dulcis]|uniref:E3 ubiquitin-protein ligase RMA n=1 Tax=Prunus dulcis TaxID=3755 RepID=A0A5E4G967_PRUDU|nr:PREDICTED: E3 ubiquitin-ligase [Prunus dulcis]